MSKPEEGAKKTPQKADSSHSKLKTRMENSRKALRTIAFFTVAAIGLSALNFAFAKASENYHRNNGDFVNHPETEQIYTENSEDAAKDVLLGLTLGGLAITFTAALAGTLKKEYQDSLPTPPQSENTNLPKLGNS